MQLYLLKINVKLCIEYLSNFLIKPTTTIGFLIMNDHSNLDSLIEDELRKS